MRRLVLTTIVLGCGAAGAAAAQPPLGFPTSPGPIAGPLTPSAADHLAGAAFLDRETYATRQGLTRWTSAQAPLGHSGSAVDSLRVSAAGPLRTQGGLPLNLDRGEFDNRDYDVTLIRSWPRAINVSDGKYELDVSPHAGVGVGSRGGSAEAGAMLTIGQKREQRAVEALKDLGVREGSEYGDQGRWYLFAAASGRAVGLNVLRRDGDWSRGNWTTDDTGELVGDAQVGVGWRKGDMQSSFGVIHREVKGNHMIFGQKTRDDTVAAFTFSIRPQN